MRKLGPLVETTEVEVAFHEVDLMAVVWHGHYLKYLELARWRLMDRIGYGFAAMRSSGYLWPIIESHIRHVRSAAYGERLEVTASLVEWESRLAINYLISNSESHSRVARARTVQVAVRGATGELQFMCPPEFVRLVETKLADIHA
jgi:acyl-CoA thioester hydrolase